MTKKDFEMIAKVIAIAKAQANNWHNPEDVVYSVAAEFVKVLSQENPRFDGARFIKACGF